MVDMSFGFYVDMFGLVDCWVSREKILEVLIFGECMCLFDFYSEVFVYVVGKYLVIMDL